jgi:hypothetical protein
MPLQTNLSGLAYAEGSVARPVYEGQTVVVRYDASQPTDGTVLSQPTPQSRPNGLYGVFIGVLGFVGFGTLWIVSGCQSGGSIGHAKR